jgi:putative DNA primase/helicase
MQTRAEPAANSLENGELRSLWENIPQDLKVLPQWVCAHSDKIPKNPKTGLNASVTDPFTWSTFEEAVGAGYPHIGFVFTKNDPFLGIDLDKPANEQERKNHNLIYEKVVSYTELSVSKTGVHIIAKGEIPNAVKRNHVEIYSEKRFFIMTGDHIVGRPATIEDCNDVVNAVVEQAGAGRTAVIEHDEPEKDIDQQVLDKCASYSNGEHFTKLWIGQWTPRYGSQSEADFALVNMLAFVSPNNDQVKRLFRLSGLGQRDKAMREDYLDRMIGKYRATQHLPTVDFSNFQPPAAISVPKPVPNDTPDVPAFDPADLPDSLRPFITDIAERMQCPLDYPAVACMVALSSVVGRQVTIRPQELDDWTVVPNLWGAVVGTPGAMKSPPMKEVLKPVELLEEAARERHEHNLSKYDAQLKVAKQANKVADQEIKAALSDGDEQRAEEIAVKSKRQEPKPPTRQRYLTQDTTIEKLGELLSGNPNGILVYRDELVGWLSTLEKQGHESDRAFYLEAWDGNGRFTFDRISRGTIEIEAATVSILGGIQPGPMTAYLTSALKGGVNDDGLLQRFQLAVWPDQSRDWTPVDRKPNLEARQLAHEVFLRLSALHQVSASRDISSPLPYLRFDHEAQALFKEWRRRLEVQLRSGNEPEVFESVIAKQRSLLPSLALLIHLADHPEGGSVSLSALLKAIGWVEYLEGHARRIYATALDTQISAIRALVKRLQDGDLDNVFKVNNCEAFTARDVYKNHWKGLDRESTIKALDWLVKANWLWRRTEKTGGRPIEYYHVHPSVLKCTSLL